MNIRLLKEEKEEKFLSPYAFKSKNSAGREKFEEKCDLRTCFQRDRDRIIHSKAFRRLKHKTQVFISPEGDHFRTRLSHTIEVSQVARTIASSLFLNEDLTEAIALGHDLGHTPFGHLGEEVLSSLSDKSFHHNEQSIRVLQKLEKDGEGLNLTFEVLDGILNHRSSGKPKTLEGKVVQISDKIAYISHDIDDAIRAGILTENDLPKECTSILGSSAKDIIDFLIRNVINNSFDKNDIILDKNVKESMYKLRKFLFKNVYEAEMLLKEREEFSFMLKELYYFYLNNFDKVPLEFSRICKNGDSKELAVQDYLAGMTDRYAIKKYESIKI